MEKEINKGVESLMLSVQHDCNKDGEGCFNPNGCDKQGRIKCFHRYCNKYKWVLDRAEHYAKALGATKEEVLKVWETSRNYGYMNYYQDGRQPEIQDENVHVFEDQDQLLAKIGKEFRCPACEKISTNPYECSQDDCDWKSYGLMGTMGKGVTIILKNTLQQEHIFKPVSFEPK